MIMKLSSTSSGGCERAEDLDILGKSANSCPITSWIICRALCTDNICYYFLSSITCCMWKIKIYLEEVPDLTA